MTTITGSIERITFYNEENGYTVLRLNPDKKRGERIPGLNLEGLLTVIGNFPSLSPGENIKLQGDYVTHPKHGLQFNAVSCEQLQPVTSAGIERYLGSGLIRGIGPELAKRIVSHFQEDTLEIIENEPEKLKQVSGIGEERTEKILNAWEEQKKVKEIMLFLHDHQISTNLAVKIYKTYGDQSLKIVKENPYQLEQDIYGIGFKTADKIAQNLGLPETHPSRIEAGLIYTINEMVNEGHVFAPTSIANEQAAALLGLDGDCVRSGLDRLSESGRIIRDVVRESIDKRQHHQKRVAEEPGSYGSPIVYLAPFYHSEKGVAEKLSQLAYQKVKPWQRKFEFKNIHLSNQQIAAIESILSRPVSILTGGPGTGKTTCLKFLIEFLESQNVTYALASPTGRAAKRLSEATGRPASTIHRLLGFSPGKGYVFSEKKTLEIQFLVVDEASMLDLLLTFHLLKAIKSGTQVLFVGDVDQLPSVGAGNILRDLINSSVVNVCRLDKIFRQTKGSEIITNAHRINLGNQPIFSTGEAGDFFLFPANNASKAAEWILELVCSRIPQKFHVEPMHDIQVITPMYRGEAGVDGLNKALQEVLNIPHPSKPEQNLFGRLFRVGDKVMQIRNNYDKDVFNGDIGLISKINKDDQALSVNFDNSRMVSYDFSEADEIVHAYAITVHKSQGSEFPVVVMPVITQHYVMLQRNLIYTAVTRAKSLCVIVGNNRAIRIAINNSNISDRFSNLGTRIREAAEKYQ